MVPHAEEHNGTDASLSSNGSTNGLTNGFSHSESRGTVTVDSPNVAYDAQHITSNYTYRTTSVAATADGTFRASPRETQYSFRTASQIPKTGVLLVGWGGNNGTTVTAGILANRHKLVWPTREGHRTANYYGSVIMGSTVKLGVDAKSGAEVHTPLHKLMPMVHPNDLIVGGWDITGMNMADAMDRAKVLEPGLKDLVRKQMQTMTPMKSVYYPDFIAANQEARVDNILEGRKACWEHVEHIQRDIETFKRANALDKVIVQWTANTERYADLVPGVNDTAANLLASIKSGHPEIAPSTIFAVASILAGAPFINGSPQNTFVPGVIDLAVQYGAFIGGDDFKSGQTKMKSALVDFLIGSGIKLTSIASYNHLGNNDGMNLSSHKQFRSKEISKSNVVDDMVAANHVLYDKEKGEHPDHCVVIKYMPAVGDNKRALDEYYGEIFLGGHQTISVFNVCEDSLLASPLIIDLVLVAEMMTRIQWKEGHNTDAEWKGFHSVLSVLSFMLKAPLTPPGTPVVNALAKQRSCMVSIFRACIGLEPENDMTLEHKLFAPELAKKQAAGTAWRDMKAMGM